MRSWRIFGFVAAILFGAAVGMLAGWFIVPPAETAAEPASLRSDYKADYVLMTAEIFSQDGDAAAARERLSWLGETDALQAVQEAILTGQNLGYAQAELQRLARLYTSLQTPTPAPETTQP